MKWSAEEEATLRKWHAMGKSFGDIARHLPGRDRNMVAGKCWRLGLCEPQPGRNFSGKLRRIGAIDRGFDEGLP